MILKPKSSEFYSVNIRIDMNLKLYINLQNNLTTVRLFSISNSIRIFRNSHFKRVVAVSLYRIFNPCNTLRDSESNYFCFLVRL